MSSGAPKRQPDVLLYAHAAVNLSPGFSGNARRVAGAILAHWNRLSGQCDPSVERLATMLNIDRATVLRATAELCDGPHRLFDKRSHGGKAHRASYAPRWSELRAIVEDWNLRMLTGSRGPNVAKVRPTQSQNRDLERRKTATQTYRRNLLKEPSAVETPQPSAAIPAKKRTAKQMPGQGWLLLPLPGGQSHADAALQSAQRRIMEAVLLFGKDVYETVCVTATDQMMADAAENETRQRGTGAHMLLQAVLAELADQKRRSA